jgi:hypothetical protein
MGNAPKCGWPAANKYSLRSFLEKSITGVVLATTVSFPAWAQGKVSKASARYQNKPKGKQQCSGCRNFQAPTSCKVVEGSVSPKGWCRHFSDVRT